MEKSVETENILLYIKIRYYRMKRVLMDSLIEWKNKSKRKPLIIHGARQVGKTWLMKEFGSLYFKDSVYINFDNNEKLKNVFDLDYNIERIISALKIESERNFNPENTLIIFDEIQECPKALTALKYFCESERNFYVIAAGSLLGMALHEGTNFPVGKVDLKYLYPLSFYEFLLATKNESLAELLKGKDYDLINAYHEKYCELLKLYYFIGGMPEAVANYIEYDDLKQVREIQENLISYYESDFSKHAPKESLMRIQLVWNSVPSQLAKENRKFIYRLIREGARAKDFELAIQWLSDYGLIYKSYRVKKPGFPLNFYEELFCFKIFMLDVGLLAAKSKLSAKVLLEKNEIFTEFKGSLTEQFIAQELACSRNNLYYYSNEKSTAEIDFVIQKEDIIIPIEVKAQENLKSRSLKMYCQKYSPKAALRSSMSKYRKEEWMTNVPLFLLSEYLKQFDF
ncbi:MAG: ATP-binding protein [Treponema sp.]|nr:ATP-binding protein [Spirochaetales bacterium]MDY5811862.1 ATP-binding protein [Treponema sp.]